MLLENDTPTLFFFQTTTEGAQTSVQVAVDPRLAGETGAYFVECQKKTSIIDCSNKKELDFVVKTTCRIVRLEEAQLEAYIQPH